MYIIQSQPNENGGYPAIQSWRLKNPPVGCYFFPEEFMNVFYDPSKVEPGFVTIEADEQSLTVTSCVWNEEAYQAYIASLPDPIDSVRTQKEQEISDACNAAIVAGMDVETTKGTEHFSLQETDQINLTTAYNAVLSGAEGYPYHADGTLCRLFTAKEITDVSNASIQHKLYHTTLCNHLLTWIRRAKTEDELNGITYSADGLPEDLAQNMQQVLTASTSLTA